jgi:peptide deformylase
MKIVQYPHPALRAKCRPLATLDGEVRTAAAQMLDLMYRHEGLGLAAPQVALDYQLIVINFDGDSENKELELVAVNPVIVEGKGVEKDREGCLSFPGLYQDIRRFKTVKVQYYGLDGALHEMTCDDLAARIWQHEIDHLNGTLFIDKMGPLARRGSKKYLESYISEFEEGVKKGSIPPGTQPKF